MPNATYADWITSALTLSILLIRLIVSRRSPHVSRLSNVLVILSILLVTARVPVIYYVLEYGTAVKALGKDSAGLDRAHIKVGSILTLVARCIATLFYWLQIATLLLFWTHVLDHIDWCRRMIKGIWATLVCTYVACLLSIFLECRPFSRYWVIDPTPDLCTRAYVQVFMQGGLNIVLDLMLLIVSIPLWTQRQVSISETLRVVALLLIGTFCIIVSGLRLAYVVGANSQQSTRSFWASIQILTCAFVANAPTIYGSVRLMIRRREATFLRTMSRDDSIATLSLAGTRTKDQAVSNHDIEHIT